MQSDEKEHSVVTKPSNTDRQKDTKLHLNCQGFFLFFLMNCNLTLFLVNHVINIYKLYFYINLSPSHFYYIIQQQMTVYYLLQDCKKQVNP